jgi:hypothetical protein
VITATVTVPVASGGEVAVMDVLEFTVKLAAGVVPKRTALAPVKSVPVSVSDVPPAVLPVDGLRLVTVGAEAAVKVYWSPLAYADKPLNVATLT